MFPALNTYLFSVLSNQLYCLWTFLFGFASTIHPPTATLLDIMTETLFATQFHQKLVSTILKTLYGGTQCLELCVVFVSANCR